MDNGDLQYYDRKRRIRIRADGFHESRLDDGRYRRPRWAIEICTKVGESVSVFKWQSRVVSHVENIISGQHYKALQYSSSIS